MSSFQRLPVEERRARLLELGERLFVEHGYDELSMARIAKEAGISKALLYHYFPSKQAFFVATLAENAAELERRVTPDPELPPAQALLGSVQAYLGFIDEHPETFSKLLRSAQGIPEIRQTLEQIRTQTADRILEGIGAQDRPTARMALAGWLLFMDGAILDWIAHRDVERDQVAGLLLGTLVGSLHAAGCGDLLTT